MRLPPAFAVPKQRSLLLRASDGDAEFLVPIQAERGLREATQEFLDGSIIDRLAFDPSTGVDCLIVSGNELECADAITANCGKKAVGVASFGADPFGDATAQRFGVSEASSRRQP